MKTKAKYVREFKSFYNSSSWKRLRDIKFAEVDGLCENCAKRGIVRAGVEVHHIVPIEVDWDKRYDYDNLILLCRECHNEMHARGGDFSKFLDELEGE